MKNWPRLYYTNDAGKSYEWDIWVNGDAIHTLYGGVGDVKQTAVKLTTPKNTGKSNATTAEEQAVLEAEAMWVYKKERRYSETKSASKITEKLRPMLAKKLKSLAEDVFPVEVQPKLDGIRCLIRANGDDVEMISRSGKPIENCEHIRKQVIDMHLPPTVIDGELYVHGMTFQAIVRLVKKYRPGKSENVDFVYYDSYTEETKGLPWTQRHMFKETSKNVRKLTSLVAHDEIDIKTIHSWNIEKGFEGSIIRLSRGIKNVGYRTGARSAALLKLKDFLDSEYTIVGYTEGIGRFTGCVIYECETKDGLTFNVVPKGTMEERKAWYTEADSHIGQKLTVRYFEKTEDNIPRFPVGVGIRWERDLDG